MISDLFPFGDDFLLTLSSFEILFDKNLFSVEILSRPVECCGFSGWGRREDLDLFRVGFQNTRYEFFRFDLMFLGAAGERRDEVVCEEKRAFQFPNGSVEKLLELFKIAAVGLVHEVGDIFDYVFGSDFHLPRNVVRKNFFKIFLTVDFVS